MMVPSIFNDNLFDDWFDDDFFMPAMPDFSDTEKKLYGKRAAHVMKTDVKETDKGYEVDVDLPGFNKDEIHCSLKDGYLTISADKKVDNDKKNSEGKYLRRERYAGSVSRTFYVGDDMKQEDIHASFRNGILTLTLPKMEEQKKVEDKGHDIPISA
ncbi:MAG: Hsp20/alpha crystallin family protein [Lachnospiraceae bacterium]|nr:Hsp20/alpha crystallin family protein [Lachnospiraceae bacterium]